MLLGQTTRAAQTAAAHSCRRQYSTCAAGPRRFPLQLAQHAQFVAADRVDCGLAVLRPADVQRRIGAVLYSSEANATGSLTPAAWHSHARKAIQMNLAESYHDREKENPTSAGPILL